MIIWWTHCNECAADIPEEVIVCPRCGSEDVQSFEAEEPPIDDLR